MVTVRELLEDYKDDVERLQVVSDLIARRYTDYVYERIFRKAHERGLRLKECAGLILETYFKGDLFNLATEMDEDKPPVSLEKYGDFEVRIIYSLQELLAQTTADYAGQKICPITMVEAVMADLLHCELLAPQFQEMKAAYSLTLTLAHGDRQDAPGKASIMGTLNPGI